MAEQDARGALAIERQEGRAEGRVEGRAEGILEGKRDALRLVLQHRGLSLMDAQRAAIAACNDGAQLDAWFQRALTAVTADDVFR